jgi:O-antigen/teichoic acid export membrane protein
MLNQKQVLEIKRKTVVGATSYFIRTAFLQGLGLLAVLILSAFFRPEDFGIYGFVTQIIGLLVFFSDIGLAASLVQKKDQPSKADYQTAFTLQQLLSWLIVIIILIILSTGLVQSKVGQTGSWILLALGISFPLATLKTIPSIILERKLDFNKLIIPQIFEQIVFQGLLIYLAFNGYGVISYAYAILARSIIGVIVMSFIQPWPIGIKISKHSIKSLLGFGVKFQLNDFLARIKDQLFYLALGIIMPLKEFGYLQWAKNWSMYPYNLTVQNVLAITFPTFSRLQAQKDLLKKAIDKSIFFITLSIFPILVGMSVFIYPLTEVVSKYHKWQPAIFSFILFTASISWAAISTPMINTLNAIGQINKTLKLMSFWTVLTWVLTPILYYKMGFNGVALASLLISFTSFFAVILVKKIIDINVWENVWRQLASSIVMIIVGLLGMSFWTQSIQWLIIGGLISSVSYLLSMLILGKNKLLLEFNSLRKI